MPIAYKLTGQNLQTHNGFQWKIGETVKTSGDGDLCSNGWLHFYSHPLLAILHNPIHANIKNPRLFRAKVGGKFKDDNGIKCGYTEGTLIEELPLLVMTTTQKTAYAILVSLCAHKEKGYVLWAKNWLSGKDRTRAAAAWAEAVVHHKNLGKVLIKCAKQAMKY